MAYETYKPSGAFTAMSIPLGLIVGLVVAIAGAWGYQFLTDLIPTVFLNFLITGLFAFGVGVATGIGLRLGHCRNGMVVILVSLATCFGAVAASHYFARDNVLATIEAETTGGEITMEDVDSIRELSAMDYLSVRAELGYGFSKGGTESNITGGGAWAVWVVEGLAIIFVGLFAAFGVALIPYCESSGAYCDERTLGVLGNVDINQVNAGLASGDLGAMMMPARHPSLPASITFTLYSSPSGQGPTYLSGKLKYLNGKKEDSLDLFNEALVTPEQVEALHSYIMQAPDSPAMQGEPTLDSDDGFDDL